MTILVTIFLIGVFLNLIARGLFHMLVQAIKGLLTIVFFLASLPGKVAEFVGVFFKKN
jgi:hypothetical protein